MKRILIALVLAAALIVVLAGTAMADNGPHGGYNTITDECAGCHRAHTANAANLLLDTGTYALCITCHGTTAGGADTDVLSGVYDDDDGTTA